jgi:hypothetical protein
MRAARLQELEKLGAKLQATARELPTGPDRQNILHDIGRLRAQVAALRWSDLQTDRLGTKAKGK